MADLQTGYQHTAIMTCHLYIFQPAPLLPPRPPHLHHPQTQTTMSWLMISFPLGRQIYPFHFFATPWTFINSDRITSGTGCTGTGLGHTQWVGECGQGDFGGEKVLLFQSRLNITIIKLQSWLAGGKVCACVRRKKRSSDIGGPGFCHLV